MSKPDLEKVREVVEDFVEDSIDNGYHPTAAIKAGAAALEAIDDVVPVIDRLLGEDDYENALEMVRAWFHDPERKARRLARRSARKAFMGPAIDGYRKAGVGPFRAWLKARKDWRKSPERAEVSS